MIGGASHGALRSCSGSVDGGALPGLALFRAELLGIEAGPGIGGPLAKLQRAARLPCGVRLENLDAGDGIVFASKAELDGEPFGVLGARSGVAVGRLLRSPMFCYTIHCLFLSRPGLGPLPPPSRGGFDSGRSPLGARGVPR